MIIYVIIKSIQKVLASVYYLAIYQVNLILLTRTLYTLNEEFLDLSTAIHAMHVHELNEVGKYNSASENKIIAPCKNLSINFLGS